MELRHLRLFPVLVGLQIHQSAPAQGARKPPAEADG